MDGLQFQPILHILTPSPAKQATVGTIRKSLNGSGNTFPTQRINTDSIGRIILCKDRVELNKRAATGILYAFPTFWLSALSLCMYV